ncbi:MAG: hypothetical protein E6Q97_35770 [Desulfurellales bacterium]|nr:MAG: hypothetical protein E6Q97_35770 [Desulfurellales bacterium]
MSIIKISARDPRVDPQVDDVLRRRDDGHMVSRRVHFVQDLDGNMSVFWSANEGFQHTTTIAEWRAWAATATVIEKRHE